MQSVVSKKTPSGEKRQFSLCLHPFHVSLLTIWKRCFYILQRTKPYRVSRLLEPKVSPSLSQFNYQTSLKARPPFRMYPLNFSVFNKTLSKTIQTDRKMNDEITALHYSLLHGDTKIEDLSNCHIVFLFFLMLLSKFK